MNSSCFVPNCKNTAAIPFPRDINSIEKFGVLLKFHNPNSSGFMCVQHFNDIRRHQESKGSCEENSSGKCKNASIGSTESVPNAFETNELESHYFGQQNDPEVCETETVATSELPNHKVAVGDNLEQVDREVSKSLKSSAHDWEHFGLDGESSLVIMQSKKIVEEPACFGGSLSYCEDIKDEASEIITANISPMKLTDAKIGQIGHQEIMEDLACKEKVNAASYNVILAQPEPQSTNEDSDHCVDSKDFDEHNLCEYDSLLDVGQEKVESQEYDPKTNFNDFHNGYLVYEKDNMLGTPVNNGSCNPEILCGSNETCTASPQKEEQKYSITEERSDNKLEKCRLCMRKQTDTKNVFNDYIEQNVPVYSAIQACFSPIQVCRTDKLSKSICLQCWIQLKTYFKFRKAVLQNDKTQRELSNQNNDNHKRESDSTSPLPKKIKIGNTYLTKVSAKKELGQAVKNKSLPVQSGRGKSLCEGKVVQDKEKFVAIEDELRKVLCGTLTKKQSSADNIIIHVQDDSEFQKTKMIFLDAMGPPVISRPVCVKTIITGEGIIKKCISTPSLQKMSASKPDKLATIRHEVLVKQSEKKVLSYDYKSDLGVFDALPVTCLYDDTQFCLLDGYLFEYRLLKEKSRGLKCILPTCRASAVQEMSEPNMYKGEAQVIIAHNHDRSTEADKKRHMLLHIMRRKLERDKGVNLKTFYESICEKDPSIRNVITLKSIILEVCGTHAKCEPTTYPFEQLYVDIEDDSLYKVQFTITGKQFYQSQFTADGSKAIIFANPDIVKELSSSKLMYVDASFKIDTSDNVKFQLLTILIWVNDSYYYPAIFVLINRKTQGIYKKVFQFIHDTLAPKLRPADIVTDYEANLYYALGEIYVESCIGGSVFYFTQNLYKKVCALNLCKELETNSYFRNIYHMLLMLPLLPVNTILDGLSNLEIQAKEMKLFELMKPLFQHVRFEWIEKVTPDLFCVHRLENRINENVMAPFKKLRDLLLMSKGKIGKTTISLVNVVEKLIELENYLQTVHSDPNKKYFSRDLSSTQKRNVLKAWQFIESHPKININTFFSKVLGYIKCMENQLWIWGFYRYTGDCDDELINSSNFSIIANDGTGSDKVRIGETVRCHQAEEQSLDVDQHDGQVVVDGVIDEDGSFVLRDADESGHQTRNVFLKYVCDT